MADRRFPRVRGVLVLAVVLLCEVAGILVAGALWVGYVLRLGQWQDYLRWNFELQNRWAGSLFGVGRILLRLRTRLEGSQVETSIPTDRPVVLLARHASVIDTLLPAVLISSKVGTRLRYVLKASLLWDPCLDIVGHRLPNAFVRRGVDQPAEIAKVAALARGLGPGEGVLIYPEGTRVTSEKKTRIERSLEARGEHEVLALSRSLEHTLPPLLGGTLAILDACPDADVVVLNHVGLEPAVRLGSLWRGTLIDREITVHLRHIPAAEIPRGATERAAWLYSLWRDVDAWLSVRGAPRVQGARPHRSGLQPATRRS